MSDESFTRLLRRNCHRESLYDELAQLEMQFRNAYTKKSLDTQLAEKQADKIAKQEIEASIEERKVLVEIDELMDTVRQLVKRKQHDFHVKKIRHEQLLFEEIRAIKRAINEEKELETLKIERLYMKEIEQRSCEINTKRENKLRCREKLIENVAKLFIDGVTMKYVREELIGDSLAEEIMYKEFIEECERENKKLRGKKELSENLKSQMLVSIECESRAMERERLFADEVMKRVMKHERLAQLTAETRKRKQKQYKEELEKLIEDKIKIRNEILQRKIKEEFHENKKNDEIIKQRIKEERRRLIIQHAGNIVGYLKDGILSNDEQNIVKELLKKCNVLVN